MQYNFLPLGATKSNPLAILNNSLQLPPPYPLTARHTISLPAALCDRRADGTDYAHPHVEGPGVSGGGLWGGGHGGGRAALPLHDGLSDRPARLRDPRHRTEPIKDAAGHWRRQPQQPGHLPAAHTGPRLCRRCK